jgi:DNA-binding SARP family transcriptional activator
MAELCALAIEREIEPETARHVVVSRRIAPGLRARTLPAWPWGARVEALGHLEIVRDGRPRAAGKPARKPRELLALLVASGPRGARASALAQALWPHADGDTAQHALETTAYRLRRLLGDPAAVVHRGGRVAIDGGRVFVDAWAFDALASTAEAARHAGYLPGAARWARRAAVLFTGEPFADEEHPLLAEPRAQLARRFRALAACGG